MAATETHNDIATEETNENSYFTGGAQYLKADFHLHTKSDKEFKTDIIDEQEFVEKYIHELKKKDIKLGAITNHNKFNREEFNLLREAAIKEDIFLLPGIELSMKDGKRGLHALIIFSPEDCENTEPNSSKIDVFLSIAFRAKPRFDSEGDPERCELDLDETIENLQELKCRYFIVLAHVDNNCGFFQELRGGRIMDYLKKGYFRNQILACQDAKENTKNTFLNNWVKNVAKDVGKAEKNYIPAFISASDPKKLDQVGNKYTYLKIGDYSFDAIRFSLVNHEIRVKDKTPEFNHPCITRLFIETGKLMSNIDIQLNSDMTNLIGIRGSGKSAFIEAIRYALEIDAKEDSEYKENLLKHAIGPGGKITLEVQNSTQKYRIERIVNERPKVYRDEEYKPDLLPSSIFRVVYYGQKDIQKQSMERGTQIELIDQFIGEELRAIKEKIHEKETEIKKILKNSGELNEQISKEENYKTQKAALEDKINTFEKMKIAEKLKKEANFRRDEVIFNQISSSLENSKKHILEFKNKITNEFSFINSMDSEENPKLFESVKNSVEELKTTWLKEIQNIEKAEEFSSVKIKQLKNEFTKEKNKVEDEIAKIKREIDITEVSPDDFGEHIQEIEEIKLKLSKIGKQKEEIIRVEKQKKILYSDLQNLWHKEWSIREQKKEEINSSQELVHIEIKYKQSKQSYDDFMISFFKGTRFKAEKLQKLTQIFTDNIELFYSLDDRERFHHVGFTDNEWTKFKERIFENEVDFCLFRVPDLIEIKYKEKSIQHLSLGQRASALLMLLLAQENIPVIMDQPEDDLDNQTVYEGLIKKIIELKGQRQIIFATHNPNIPVLGDCEKIVVFKNESDKAETEYGSIDRMQIQKKIVNIMEGGEEAFTRRKNIYNQWIV
ncbi:hypothetical protein MSSIT_3870 [Methanosarcina siciliae T4/M]|uniref:Rad50/SbcC-type AAA domain-containing protein n=1 Tax=Methanosarcina siciliae T4/M TaxID=1434120 RepID=A0A0E3P986_9EURY|nr:hypothetical protein [Methanosarcina siciliae]AKB30589.1 hypothetical protein MSSIT_3870 [Methanosarcina siciliae T4/M]